MSQRAGDAYFSQSRRGWRRRRMTPSRSARVMLSVTSCPLFVVGTSVPRKCFQCCPPRSATVRVTGPFPLQFHARQPVGCPVHSCTIEPVNRSETFFLRTQCRSCSSAQSCACFSVGPKSNGESLGMSPVPALALLSSSLGAVLRRADQKNVWMALMTWYSLFSTSSERHLSKVRHGCEISKPIISPTRRLSSAVIFR